MSDTQIATDDNVLFSFIEQLSDLEWGKKQSRYPDSWIENRFQRVDHSGHPPYCSFRFAKEDPHLIACLKLAVDSYKGRVEWVMVGREREHLPGINWMICPKRYWEVWDVALSKGISAGQYMAEHEPDFGPVAYEDMHGLARHIQMRCPLPSPSPVLSYPSPDTGDATLSCPSPVPCPPPVSCPSPDTRAATPTDE